MIILIFLYLACITTTSDIKYEIIVKEDSMIEEIPSQLLCDKDISIEVDYFDFATPSQAIEEPLKHDKCMTYFGSMQMTAYVDTGSPCADGVYPETEWTVACNDYRLWHKKIYIENYGIRYVHDTGGMNNDVIDLFVGSIDEAYQIGRKQVEVWIIE